MRGLPLVVDRARVYSPADLKVSVVSRYELEVGVLKCKQPKRERQKLDRFFHVVGTTIFDQGSAHMAARIRAELEEEGVMIGPYDVLIAATALANDLTLVTSNVKEFERIETLSVQNWRVATEESD